MWRFKSYKAFGLESEISVDEVHSDLGKVRYNNVTNGS
jgi:hypothetical protein